MKRLVIDSSVIVKWLNTTNESHVEEADKILSDARVGTVELFTPELAKYEAGNTLLLGKKISSQEIGKILQTLYSFPIQFIPETLELAQQTFLLAERLKITYYDASFLALAKQYEATLVTENIKHQGKSADITVVLLKDY